jgi:hypothetical protein
MPHALAGVAFRQHELCEFVDAVWESVIHVG